MATYTHTRHLDLTEGAELKAQDRSPLGCAIIEMLRDQKYAHVNGAGAVVFSQKAALRTQELIEASADAGLLCDLIEQRAGQILLSKLNKGRMVEKPGNKKQRIRESAADQTIKLALEWVDRMRKQNPQAAPVPGPNGNGQGPTNLDKLRRELETI